METPDYRGSQQELYEVSRIGWKNFNNNLPFFTDFSPRYNLAYSEARVAEIDAAEMLPANDARSSISEDNRILLTRAADACLVKWQNLKRYTIEAYDAERAETMLKAAGQPVYFDAGNYNWQSVKALVTTASTFIKDHKTDLVANENMPPNFGDSFDATKDVFVDLQTKFFGSVTDTTLNTQNKIKANNAVYAKLSKMLQDGQQIFWNDESVKQQFVYSHLKSIVGGLNQAGLRGFVTDATTGFAIADATIVTANTNYATTSNNEGQYNLKMAADDYSILVSAPGYVSQTFTATVKKGMISSLNVALVVVEIK